MWRDATQPYNFILQNVVTVKFYEIVWEGTVEATA